MRYIAVGGAALAIAIGTVFYTTGGSSPPVVTANVFVAANGSDSGTECKRNGSLIAFPSDHTQVCATLNKADSLMVQGDIALVAGGTYTGETIANHTHAGAVTFAVVSGDTATFGGLTLQGPYISMIGPWVFTGGIDMENIDDNVDRTFHVHDIAIKNFQSGPVSIRATHVLLQHGVVGPWHVCTQGGEDGIQLSALFYSSAIQDGTSYITLDDVTVHDIDRWNDPDVGAPSGVCSPHTDGIQTFGGQHITIENSHIYRTATSLIISKPEGTSLNAEDHILVTNNMFGQVLEDGNSVLIGGTSQDCSGTNDIVVQNNTFRDTSLGTTLRVGCTGTPTIVRNNILPPNQVCTGADDNGAFTYNVFQPTADASCTSTTGAVVCVPLWADANRVTTGDYKRQASDTCASNKGDPVNFTTPDIFGVPRPQGIGPDAAADEYYGPG